MSQKNEERTVPADRFRRLLDAAVDAWSEVQALHQTFERRRAIHEQHPTEHTPAISDHDLQVLERAKARLWDSIEASGVRPRPAGAIADLERIAEEIEHLGLGETTKRLRAAIDRLRPFDEHLATVAP